MGQGRSQLKMNRPESVERFVHDLSNSLAIAEGYLQKLLDLSKNSESHDVRLQYCAQKLKQALHRVHAEVTDYKDELRGGAFKELQEEFKKSS